MRQKLLAADCFLGRTAEMSAHDCVECLLTNAGQETRVTIVQIVLPMV